MRGLFGFMKKPKMQQCNHYHRHAGISSHAGTKYLFIILCFKLDKKPFYLDEMRWFGGDKVYTVRLLGRANLHFGMWACFAAWKKGADLSELFVPVPAGTCLVMGGIFQSCYKHSIPSYDIHCSDQERTWILRDVFEEAIDQWTYQW